MDVVVTTPHGDADIEIVAARPQSTLADLLQSVTGQSPPVTARVDGRAVSCATRLTDVALVIGSTIDTRPTDTPGSISTGSVGIVQLTGRGAGTVRNLTVGRYLVGSARSLQVDELGDAPVETAAFEIVVDDDGSVRASPSVHLAGARGPDAPTLAGRLFDRELPWEEGQLHVAGRRFVLEQPPTPAPRRRLSDPAEDGTVPFRRNAAAPTTPRRLVVSAVRDAATAGGQLWQWRPGDRGAYDIHYGLHLDGVTAASVDLLRHPGVAVVGSERFTSALTRTMLIEACTMHGPASLDLVIASNPELSGRWNWAQWLPHLRGGRPTSAPMLLTDPTRIGEWAESRARPHAAGRPGRTTLLIIDDTSLWDRRESPLHTMLTDLPDDVRVVALCDSIDDAPSMCSQILEEMSPSTQLASESRGGTSRPGLFGSLVAQHSRDDPATTVTIDISPALVEEPLALTVARHLAPLDDLDREHDRGLDAPIPPPSLTELVESSASNSDDPSRLTVTIGAAEAVDADGLSRRDVSLELSGPLSTIITASDAEHHDLAVAAIVLGAAIQRRPDELAVVYLGRERRPWHDQLPHLAGWAGRSEAHDPERLVHRIAHVVTERPELHVLIVVERAFDQSDPVGSELITAMNELAVTFDNVHVIWTGDHPSSVSAYGRSSCGALVWITPTGDGTLWYPDRSFSFVGLAAHPAPISHATVFDGSALLVRPAVSGRTLTPLERRLERQSLTAAGGSGSDAAITAIARSIGDRVDESGRGEHHRPLPTLLPPPLPVRIDATALFAQNPGDAVPIGLIDRPERADHEAHWWHPGRDGSVLAVGSPRSAMTSLIDVIALGVAARYSADDVHVYAIEAPGRRSSALEALPHTGRVVDPSGGDDVVELISGLRSMLTERLRRPTDLDRPDVVLLISDLGRMRRALPPDELDTTFEQLGELVASGAWVGMNVVAIAERVDDLGPLDRLTGDRLVGPMSDPDDRSRLGVGAVDAADRHPRRCWSTAAARRVQLATPPDDIGHQIDLLAPEPARNRPPATISAPDRP
ncbi:hypothetical protein [Ilumatobacter sp.]|uniref:hypothetical protein n=1 Tax=Ilumatobacter sp. TaxID=1967498 RepID=UPI003C35C02A